MTAIWGYCVFWPKRVVYDRWQGRKSRAAGSNTDMQIAFSWLLHSLQYLSSGLQHARFFTARKQLINSAKGWWKERRCFCFFHSVAWKLRPLKWPVRAVKLVHKCMVFFHTKADIKEKRRRLRISVQCWDWSGMKCSWKLNLNGRLRTCHNDCHFRPTRSKFDSTFTQSHYFDICTICFNRFHQ